MGQATKGQEKKERRGPFHIVNALTGKHIGPFTTETDCILARNMASLSSGWATGKIMDDNEFEQHLYGGKSHD